MKKILLSGFVPFGGDKVNPSEELMKFLTSRYETVVLPVSYKNAYVCLKEKIEMVRPDVVICTGLAADRRVVEVERLAINCLDFSIPDNDGVQISNQKILRDGPDGIFTTLPLSKMIPDFKISNSAGTYICNYVMYRLLVDTQNTGVQAGFVHLPGETSQNVINQLFLDLLERLQ